MTKSSRAPAWRSVSRHQRKRSELVRCRAGPAFKLATANDRYADKAAVPRSVMNGTIQPKADIRSVASLRRWHPPKQILEVQKAMTYFHRAPEIVNWMRQ